MSSELGILAIAEKSTTFVVRLLTSCVFPFSIYIIYALIAETIVTTEGFSTLVLSTAWGVTLYVSTLWVPGMALMRIFAKSLYSKETWLQIIERLQQSVLASLNVVNLCHERLFFKLILNRVKRYDRPADYEENPREMILLDIKTLILAHLINIVKFVIPKWDVSVPWVLLVATLASLYFSSGYLGVTNTSPRSSFSGRYRFRKENFESTLYKPVENDSVSVSLTV